MPEPTEGKPSIDRSIIVSSFTGGALAVGSDFLADENLLLTELISPVTVSVKLESSWPNASASPSSIGEPPCGPKLEPIGGSDGEGTAALAGTDFGAGATAGFDAALAAGFGVALATGFGVGASVAIGTGFATGLGTVLATAGVRVAGMPLALNAASGASR